MYTESFFWYPTQHQLVIDSSVTLCYFLFFSNDVFLVVYHSLSQYHPQGISMCSFSPSVSIRPRVTCAIIAPPKLLLVVTVWSHPVHYSASHISKPAAIFWCISISILIIILSYYHVIMLSYLYSSSSWMRMLDDYMILVIDVNGDWWRWWTMMVIDGNGDWQQWLKTMIIDYDDNRRWWQ